jgi:hypothetical protein
VSESVKTESSPAAAWNRPLPAWLGGVFVAGLLTVIFVKIRGGLFIPWWFNTDELVFYYEVIRQLRLDLSQTFFDIPGTPYMTLTSLGTYCWYLFERIFGMTSAASPSDFAFENAQGVYFLMRCITLGGYLVAMILAYVLFRRASGVVTAVLAATATATLPIHIHYSHFVRTESLGLVFTLIALLLVLHPRTERRWGTYFAAGALAGAAMAARFHFALVGFPVLIAIYFLRDRVTLTGASAATTPQEPLNIAGIALGTIFVVGAMVTFAFQKKWLEPGFVTHTLLLTTPAGPEQYPGAKQTVAKLWYLLGFGAVAIFAAAFNRRTRRSLQPLINPFTLSLMLGFAAGFLIAHPTFLWRGEHQLRSIQFYSDWVDPNLAALGPLRSWWNVTTYYFTTALPERWLQILFLVGAVAILVERKAVPLAFLFGAAICFVAHPVTMKLWPHHIIPWLPFLCYVAAYPVGLAIERATQRLTHPASVSVILGFVAAAIAFLFAPRLAKANEYVTVSQQRTVQIAEMNEWMKKNIPDDAFLAVSYFALNADGFFKWIENSGVSVPAHVKREGDVHLWWLQRSTLDGHAGYVCISRADIAFFRDDAERKQPGSTYNPFEDTKFKELATFGGGFYELKVFQFDLRGVGKP